MENCVHSKYYVIFASLITDEMNIQSLQCAIKETMTAISNTVQFVGIEKQSTCPSVCAM